MILAGIDEAGYGPLLGPLAVGLSAFRVEGRDPPGSLRRALDPRRHGVRVGDSKAIHHPARGVGPLEGHVLAVLAARDGAAPEDGAGLFAALGIPPPPADHPWYEFLPARALPLAADRADIEHRGAALARALREEAVSLALLRARVLPEGRFNEAVALAGTKSAVLFDESAALVEAALSLGDGEPLEVHCDRQGARARYAALLQARFPDRLVRILREGPAASAYDLGGRFPALVRFEVKADARSPATGLASMAAKYLREVWMESLNAWILRGAPGVRPTAGYWTDGIRFLRETGEARRRRGVDEALLVRRR